MRGAIALIVAACAIAGGVLLITSGHARREPRPAVTSAHIRALTACATEPNCTVRVGAPTPSGVTCTRKLNAGADVGSALSSASPGAVVCLNSGSWSALTLTGVAPASPGVTLAATPGQTVVVPRIAIEGSNTRNLAIEGFNITQPSATGGGIALLCGSTGGITFEHLTIENQPKNDAIFIDPHDCSDTAVATGVTIRLDQIDHVGEGLEVVGGSAENSDLTISHNVIGPEIGYRDTNEATDAQHYIEIGGVNGATIDNNAFEGPMDPGFETAAGGNGQPPGLHNNVLHVDGGQSNVTFNNNIMWHTESRAQTLLFQDTPMNNITVENNLDVEAPNCLTDAGCNTDPIEIYGPHGLSVEHNTIVNGYYGTEWGPTGEGYSDPQNMTAEYNISAPSASQGNYSIWNCTASCTTQDNVSGDTSAKTVLGGTGNVINWTPTWTTTTWTPVSGPGYTPPPTGYYQPTGLAVSGAGYQGQIGP